MKKTTIAILILVIVFVILLAGYSKIAKEKYIEKKIERINNIQTNSFEKNGNTENNNSDTPPKVISLKPGDYKYTIMQGETERYYLLHVPNSYSNPAPLVLAFHGGMGNANQMRNKYDWVEKSDKEGFIVAFPNGYSNFDSGKFATWNAGRCCGLAVKKQSDDVGFVKIVIDDIKSKTNIGKIFATGMSNGAMMSHRLACEMPDIFTAVAAVEGTNNYDECNPQKPISVMNVHGLLDDHVLYNGGAGPKSVSKVEFTSVPKTISDWVKRNNCNDKSERIMEVENGYCDLYKGCNEGVQVKLCVAEDGGHSWPGLTLSKIEISQAFSATDLIWDFFAIQ